MSKKTIKDFTLLINLRECNVDDERATGTIHLVDPQVAGRFRIYRFDVFHPFNTALREGIVYVDEQGSSPLVQFSFTQLEQVGTGGRARVDVDLEYFSSKPMAAFLCRALVEVLSNFIDVVVSSSTNFMQKGFDSIILTRVASIKSYRKCGAATLFEQMLEV